VPEEGAFGEAGALGDLRHGGLVEAAFGVELQCGAFEPPARVRLPSAHALDRSLTTVTDMTKDGR
jgi:hypothetical protein